MSGGAKTIRVVGRYAIYEALASGGMATVFLGRLLGPVGFGRTVAIKRLHAHYATDPSFVTMFLDEARLVARIRHPNVVPTLDVVAANGELFLVMEYVHGESLAKLMRVAGEQETPIPVAVVVSIMSGVLQGLHAAHEAKSERGVALQIIHRDVSPQNILLGRDGQARLLDFGVARADERLHTTQQGLVKGKLAYMAPEQVRGERIGPTTDIYAAAVVMWEALTGRSLFRGKGDGGLVVEVLEANVTPPSVTLEAQGNAVRAAEVKPLDDVLMRAFARRREDRWQTARELARELEACVVPATASQVSDWVERAAGPTLRERAALVAEMEHSSAVELSARDVGIAMGEPSVKGALGDGPASPALTVPERRAEQRTSDAPTAEVPSPPEDPESHADAQAPTSSHPDRAPATTNDPQPATLPLGPPKEAALAPAAAAGPSPQGPAARVVAPPEKPAPLLGTLMSIPSPAAKGGGRGPNLAETLQSKGGWPASPPAARARRQKPVEAAPPTRSAPGGGVPESYAPPLRSSQIPKVALAIVVLAGLAGAGYAYVQAHAGVKPVDTTGAATSAVPPTALDPKEPVAKPKEMER